jgi:homocysteine S-methyltransferase
MTFPHDRDGITYLTEGGQETEVTYRHGFELPEFAMYPLLDQPDAMATLRAMYTAVLDTAAQHGFGILLGGLDYRASPDWAGLLGYSADELTSAQHRCIDFLRDMAEPYRDQLPDVRIAGIVGPRGDAYQMNHTSTADEAAEYHGTQLRTLAAAEVDLAQALTFSSVAEAVGVARAASAAGVPLSISLTLDSNHRLFSGETVREAIEAIDETAGDSRPVFYGINCSHPFEFLPAVEAAPWFQRVRALRPNAASADKISLCTLGHLEEGNPVELGSLMGELARAHPHIDIWGGCCGTWATHLDEIARNVAAARTAS